jgi:hypothetical protein
VTILKGSSALISSNTLDRLERLVRDKHCSLLGPLISYKEKSFYVATWFSKSQRMTIGHFVGLKFPAVFTFKRKVLENFVSAINID